MDSEFSKDLGPFSTLGKEFSVFSLFPNEYNIDNHWVFSATLTAGGTGAKVGAYSYLSRFSHVLPQLGAKGLHFFGEALALPLTAGATLENALVAKRCECQERKNPGGWARAREKKKEWEMWQKYLHGNVPTRPASPIGFFN